jgi:hypothetical protein
MGRGCCVSIRRLWTRRVAGQQWADSVEKVDRKSRVRNNSINFAPAGGFLNQNCAATPQNLFSTLSANSCLPRCKRRLGRFFALPPPSPFCGDVWLSVPQAEGDIPEPAGLACQNRLIRPCISDHRICHGPSRELRQIHPRNAILRPVRPRRMQTCSSEATLCFSQPVSFLPCNIRPGDIGLNPYKRAIFLHRRAIKHSLAHDWHTN